ncbi:MAG TPA: DUF4404 family protein [Candidatus Eisenbacteria bacterium]|jgi:hypothetical protein
MNDEVLRSLIQQLHGALAGATSINEEDREQLEQLSAELRALLAQPGAGSHPGHRSLRDRLLAAITRFEVSHPELAATMELASKRLGDMGI